MRKLLKKGVNIFYNKIAAYAVIGGATIEALRLVPPQIWGPVRHAVERASSDFSNLPKKISVMFLNYLLI
jgi:hypothetical protein